MRFASRARSWFSPTPFSVKLCACIATMAAAVACLTSPPADLPELPPHRPTIVQATPRADVPLVAWPSDGKFIVNVEVDINRSFQWAVFVDYDPNHPFAAQYQLMAIRPQVAGVPVSVDFTPTQPARDGLCHRIDFLVAESFALDGGFSQSANDYASLHSPAGLGGDILTWWYTGGNSGCNPYDQLVLPDGGFSSTDASSDSPLRVAE